MFLLSHGVDGLRHLPHDVEPIEHDPLAAVGQAVARGNDVRLPHVHGHRLQPLALFVRQGPIVAR